MTPLDLIFGQMKSDACSGMNTRITALENAGGLSVYEEYNVKWSTEDYKYTTGTIPFVPKYGIFLSSKNSMADDEYTTNITAYLVIHQSNRVINITAYTWANVYPDDAITWGNDYISIRGTGSHSLFHRTPFYVSCLIFG